MNREQLIKNGTIIPASYFLNLARDNSERVAYERKLILLGLDLPEEGSKVIIRPKGYVDIDLTDNNLIDLCDDINYGDKEL